MTVAQRWHVGCVTYGDSIADVCSPNRLWSISCCHTRLTLLGFSRNRIRALALLPRYLDLGQRVRGTSDLVNKNKLFHILNLSHHCNAGLLERPYR